MPGDGPKSYPCCLCKRCTIPSERVAIKAEHLKLLERRFCVSAQDGDFLCSKCRLKCYREENKLKIWNALQCIRLKMITNLQSKKPEAHSSPPQVLHLLPLIYQRPAKAMHIALCVKGLGRKSSLFHLLHVSTCIYVRAFLCQRELGAALCI